MMKTISIIIPTFNEEEALYVGYVRVKKILTRDLSSYNHEILFIDNKSTDGTRKILYQLAEKDKNVKVIFNGSNVGWARSSFHGILSSTGDSAILLSADMQEPPELIPKFVQLWEEGSTIVVGMKNKSQENPIKYFLRTCYYKFMEKFSEIKHIPQFIGFGLYDKKFVEILRGLNDPIPYLRGIVAELGFNVSYVSYMQEARRQGKSHFNFLSMYDVAMLGVTSYSKIVLRFATLLGFGLGILCFFIALLTFICKLTGLVSYPTGSALLAVGMFFLGGVQLFFIGILGEYILNINTRVMHRPLVIEEKRINFNE